MKKFIFLLVTISVIFSFNSTWSQKQVTKEGSSNIEAKSKILLKSQKTKTVKLKGKSEDEITGTENKISTAQLMFSMKLNGESFQNGIVESFNGNNLVVNSNGFKMTWYVGTNTQISNLTIKTKSSPKAVDTGDESTLKTSGTNLTIKPGSIPRLKEEFLTKNQSTTIGWVQDLDTLSVGRSYKTETPESTTTIMINSPVRVHGYWDGSKLVAKKIILKEIKTSSENNINNISDIKEVNIPFNFLFVYREGSIKPDVVKKIKNMSEIKVILKNLIIFTLNVLR